MATTNYWLESILILLSTIVTTANANTITAGTLHAPCNESPTLAPCQTLHSICINNTCFCASPYSPRNGVCVFSSGDSTVNNPCASNVECYGRGEFCNFGYCRCLRTHVEVDKHCLPVIYPGQIGCDDVRQCTAAFPGSTCRNRFCECPEGSVSSGLTCVPDVGAWANSTLSRPFHYEVEINPKVDQSIGRRSHGVRGIINYQAILSHQAPAHPAATGVTTGFGTVPPGGVCSQDQECAGAPFAYCMSTCMCRDGAINAGSTCLEPGSTSRGNCGTGQVYVSEAGACMNMARPGEPCQYSQQCSGTEVGAFCVNLRCRCVYGMIVTGDGRCTFINSNCTTRGTVWISELGECKPVIAPGARTCTHRQQCIASFQDSLCFLTQCTCPEGLPIAVDGTCGTACTSGQTYSGVLGKCVPTVQPGDRCQYSSQCHAIYPGMICDKGICRCPNSQMWTGSACSAHCPAGYTMNPKTGMCRPVCRTNQVDFEGDCLDLTNPGQLCQVSHQCQGGSTCINRMCTCPHGTQNLQGACTRASSPPGGQCSDGQYCVGGSYCENGICNCPLGTVKSNQQCVTPANVPPNSPCGPMAQCSGNSVCVNGACVCPEGQVPINGFCSLPPSVAPGYPCTASDRCTLGSTCQNGVCQCPVGTFLSENRCLVPVQVPPGSACRVGAELCTGLSVCVNNVCACPAGMVAQGSLCRTPGLVSPGSSCANQERCGGGSECVNNVCACPPGTKIVNLQCQFMASVPPNFSCANGEICVGGSQCQDGMCRCPAGQTAFNQVCQYSSAGAGSSCMTNEQCTGGSSCISNTCTCRPGQTWSNGACVTANSVPPGARCHETARCGGRSRCIGGVCRCQWSEVATRNECVLVRALAPGSRCFDSAVDQQCTGGSICINDTCTCPRDTIANRDECVYLIKVPPLSSCTGGETCSGGSTCQNGVCTCPTGMTVKNQECTHPNKVPPGNACPTGAEICTGGSTCIMGICRCPAGQVIREQICSLPPLVPYNFLCVQDGECVGDASCIGGVCICPTSTLLVDGICQGSTSSNFSALSTAKPKTRTAVFVGAYCGNGESCAGGAVCTQDVCACPSEHALVDDHCVKIHATAPPGGACTTPESCGGGSVCLNNVCVCPPTYAAVNGACRPAPAAAVPPTSSCANGERCGGGSSCVRDICTCPADQVVINQRCQDPPTVAFDQSMRRRPLPSRGKRGVVVEQSEPLPKPGHPCAPVEKCFGGALCINGLCSCPNGTSAINDRCVAFNTGRMANPGESCSPLDVCTGGSFCQGGLCICPPGRGIQGYSCVTLVVGPGFSCANAERCCGGSKCTNGVCACPAGMLISEDSIQCSPSVMINRANPGQPCDFGTICGGGSWCQNNICTCPTGQIPQANTCVAASLGLSVPPGAACNLGQACGGGSSCMQDQCNCGPGMVIQNQMCVSPGSTNTAFPGQQCDFGTICTGGSVCQSGSCACVMGQTAQNQLCTAGDGTIGSQFAPPGGYCVLGVTTCMGGSFCSSGFCVCQAGQIVENQMCVFGHSDYGGLPPGSPCVPAQSICGGGSFCINSVCTCPQDQLIVNGVCSGFGGGQNTAFPGQPCDFATRCLGGSYCQNNRCACFPGQMIINNACQSASAAVMPPGGSCVVGLTSCTGGSQCTNNMCTCPVGQVVQNQICTASFTSNFGSPGSWCNSTISCTGGSICTNNACSCTVGYTVQSEMCIPSSASIPPGGSCASTTATCGGGSYCNNGICTCPTGTYAQDGQCNRQPGVWAFPGQPCLPATPCIGGSSCIGGICTCPANQVVAHNECVPKQATVLPGLACDANSICLGDSSCINGVCHCPPGQMAESGQCIMRHNAVPPGYPCIPGVSVCMGGSLCMNDRCLCPNGQIIMNEICTSIKKTRDPQNPDDMENATESRSPLQGREVPPGADCLADGTGCSGGSACSNGKCVCGPGQFVTNGICTTNPILVPPGSSCEMSNTCPTCRISCGGGSTCVFGACVCAMGQTVQNGQCVPGSSLVSSTPASLQIVPGTKCDQATSCSGGAVCKNGLCTCPEGAVLNSAMQCVPSFAPTATVGPGVELGAPCAPGQTCNGFAICRNGYCQCPENAWNQNGYCTPVSSPVASELISSTGILPVGSPCNVSAAGQQGSASCGYGSQCTPPGVCTCPVGLKSMGSKCVPVSSSGNLAPPGSPCISGMTACGGNSNCVSGQCACAENEILHDGACVKAKEGGSHTARVPTSLPPGSPCLSGVSSSASACSGGALCIGDVCICPSGTNPLNSICVGENGGVLPGNPCSTQGNCMGGSTCQNGLCACPSDQEPYGDRCVPKWKTVPPASPCAENRVCGGGSYCFNGLCTCPPAHIIQNGQCVSNDASIPRKFRDLIEKSAPPGSWCGGAVMCNGGSYCYNNVCTCPFGQLIVNLQCAEAPIVSPGSSCLNGEVCGGGSVCAQGKCTCPAGTTQSGKSCRNVFMSTRTQSCPLPENPSACALPDCYCSRNGTQIPGNLTVLEVPQMVVLTVDDALNGRTMGYIKKIFDGSTRKNPNGCEIKATFFISHEWNNYDEAQWLYHKGHEIAVNSITHQTLSNEPVERWGSEMAGMRTMLQQLSGIPLESIKGVRAPQLAVGGNSQFEMMKQNGFVYDNSMSANPGKDGPAYWPQTLDFQLAWRCEVDPCPDRSFPGMWAIPINQFYGYYVPEIQDHKRGAMVRAVMADTPEESVDTVFSMLMENFNRVYRSNRAPYIITLDAAFFQTLPNNGSIEALERFLDQVLRTPDVWIVTERQVLDWMRRPTPNNQLASFGPWQCNNSERRQFGTATPCQAPQKCTYQTQLPFGERSFKTCFSCPPSYPWLNNPSGTRKK